MHSQLDRVALVYNKYVLATMQYLKHIFEAAI